MSPNATLLFYLLLEHGSLHDDSTLLLRPLCADGRLQPPLISELRALRPGRENLRAEPLAGEQAIAEEQPLRIEFALPYANSFTPRVPWSHLLEGAFDTASCFG